MLIGQFSRMHYVSSDTIRYYIKLGFLFPGKKHNKYFFNQDCINRMDKIKLYKSMGFSLNEIKKLLDLEEENDPSKLKEMSTILIEKQRNIKDVIENLEDGNSSIQERIENITIEKNTGQTLGLPVDFLDFIQCPICKKRLDINGDNNSEQINNGTLKCSCGYSIHLDKGILLVRKNPDIDNLYLGFKKQFKNHKESMIFYHDVTKAFNDIDVLSKGQSFLNQSIKGYSKSKTIIVENNLPRMSTIRNVLNRRTDDSYHIVVNTSYEYLIDLKRDISKIDHRINVIYICGETNYLPIKDVSVDLFIDCHTNFYDSIYKPEYYPSWINEILRADGKYLFYYWAVKDDSPLHLKNKTKNDLEMLRESLFENGFKILNEELMGNICFDGLQDFFEIPGKKRLDNDGRIEIHRGLFELEGRQSNYPRENSLSEDSDY